MSADENWESLRNKIIGLGENSARKSYYPELQNRLADLQRFTALLDKTADGIIQAEAFSGIIVEINEAAAAMLKCAKENLIGKSIFQFLPSNASTRIKELDFLDAVDSSAAMSIRTKLRTFPESNIDVELAVQAVNFQKNQYIVIIARDITQQKRSEDKMKEDASWLSILYDRSPMGILVTNNDRIIIDTNRAFCEMSGYEKSELIGRHSAMLHVSEEASSAFAKGRYDKIVHGERLRIEFQFKRKDNSFYWCELVGQAIDPENTTRGTIWQIIEITDKRLAEEARLEQEYRQKRYATLLSTLINTAIFSDSAANELFEQITRIAGRIMVSERTGIWFFSEDLAYLHNVCLYTLSKDCHTRELIKKNSEVFRTNLTQRSELNTFENISELSLLSPPLAKYYSQANISAVLDAPVWVQGKLTAVISFEHVGSARHWLTDERQMALTLAAYVANCIEADERKRAEKALRLSEERLRSFIEESLEGITIVDEYGYIEEWNHMAEIITGKLRQDVLGKRWSEMVFDILPQYAKTESIQYKMEKWIEDVIVNGYYPQTDVNEYLIQLKDGTLKYIEQRISTIKTINGFRIAGIFIDVTKRHEAEAALKESEDKFRSITEQITDLIFLLDEDGYFKYLSPAAETMFKINPANIIGKKFDTFLPPEEQENVNQAFRSVIDNTVTLHEFETVLIGNDGRRHFAEINASRYKSRTISGLLGVLRDVTSRKNTEAKLLRLTKGIEQSSAIIMITDVSGIIEYVNPKFTQVTGYSYADAVGKNPKFLKSGKTKREEYQDMWRTIKSGREWKGEFLNRKKNGEYFWEQIHISPVLNERGELMSFVGIKEDITEKKEMIRQLIASKDKAEEMNRLKTNFLSNMSHELRTPLIGILGYAEIIRDEQATPETSRKAGVIFKSGMRLLDTLNQILNLSKIESNKQDVLLQEIDIIPVISEIIELFREMALKKNLLLEFKSQYSSVVVMLDRHMFAQILNNLINNAVKFTPSGSITVEISGGNNNGADIVVIKVIDTGIGISVENQSVIWEEFRQVSEGINRDYEGSGLGLTLTRQYVQRLGGKLELDSELAKGATFTVTFQAILLRK